MLSIKRLRIKGLTTGNVIFYHLHTSFLNLDRFLLSLPRLNRKVLTMMMQEKKVVQMLRPDGKKGVSIPEDQYESLRLFVLAQLDSRGDATLNELIERANDIFQDKIDSDLSWYVLQVKLDLEARGMIRSFTPPHQKRLFYLKLTRQGTRELRSGTRETV